MTQSATANQQADEAAIRAVLEQSAAAWSRGDLDGFLKSYEDSPDTQFIKPDHIVRGIPAIRAMYQAKYGTGDPAKMGTLSMSDFDVRVLGKDDAFVIAQFHVQRTEAAGGSANGFFSLLLHRTKAGWRIRVDHT